VYKIKFQTTDSNAYAYSLLLIGLSPNCITLSRWL